MKSDSEALDDAADIISGDGWIKGQWHADGNGQNVDKFDMNREKSCMLGALQLSTEDDQQYARIVSKVSAVLKRTVPGIGEREAASVYPYNDNKNTTQEDVLLALKRTKEAIEAEEGEKTQAEDEL